MAAAKGGRELAFLAPPPRLGLGSGEETLCRLHRKDAAGIMSPPSPPSKEARPLGRHLWSQDEIRAQQQLRHARGQRERVAFSSFPSVSRRAAGLCFSAGSPVCPRSPAASTSPACGGEEERRPLLCIHFSVNSSQPVSKAKTGGEDTLTQLSRPSREGSPLFRTAVGSQKGQEWGTRRYLLLLGRGSSGCGLVTPAKEGSLWYPQLWCPGWERCLAVIRRAGTHPTLAAKQELCFEGPEEPSREITKLSGCQSDPLTPNVISSSTLPAPRPDPRKEISSVG